MTFNAWSIEHEIIIKFEAIIAMTFTLSTLSSIVRVGALGMALANLSCSSSLAKFLLPVWPYRVRF